MTSNLVDIVKEIGYAFTKKSVCYQPYYQPYLHPSLQSIPSCYFNLSHPVTSIRSSPSHPIKFLPPLLSYPSNLTPSFFTQVQSFQLFHISSQIHPIHPNPFHPISLLPFHPISHSIPSHFTLHSNPPTHPTHPSSREQCRNHLIQYGVKNITPQNVAKLLGFMARVPSGLMDPLTGQVGCGGMGWVVEGWGGLWMDGVGCGGMGWVVEGWGGLWRDGVGCGGMGWVVEGWDGLWRDGMGCGGMGWVVEGWDGLWRDGMEWVGFKEEFV